MRRAFVVAIEDRLEEFGVLSTQSSNLAAALLDVRAKSVNLDCFAFFFRHVTSSGSGMGSSPLIIA